MANNVRPTFLSGAEGLQMNVSWKCVGPTGALAECKWSRSRASPASAARDWGHFKAVCCPAPPPGALTSLAQGHVAGEVWEGRQLLRMPGGGTDTGPRRLLPLPLAASVAGSGVLLRCRCFGECEGFAHKPPKLQGNIAGV